jgi:hypothetical protein
LVCDKILSAISSITSPELIFTGGTSLSKGFGLIQRFSEDLDFRICTKSQLFTRSDRKIIREKIVAHIKTISNLSVIEESILKRNESRFFSLNIEYPQINPPTQALRPHLKLEFSFEDTLLDAEFREIRSFVSQFSQADYDCQIKTISPIETAANKFSALIWRINIKDRSAIHGSIQNDPTIIRHLHDLAALYPVLGDYTDFTHIVKASFENDRGRGGSNKDKSLEELTYEAFDKLKSDIHYKKEYVQFVDAMSYAREDDRIDYDIAIIIFSKIKQLICQL